MPYCCGRWSRQCQLYASFSLPEQWRLPWPIVATPHYLLFSSNYCFIFKEHFLRHAFRFSTTSNIFSCLSRRQFFFLNAQCTGISTILATLEESYGRWYLIELPISSNLICQVTSNTLYNQSCIKLQMFHSSSVHGIELRG